MEHEEEVVKSEVEKFLKDYEVKRISTDVVIRVVTIVIAALGLIAALAWDEALKHLFERLLGESGTLREELVYAVVVTLFAALISAALGKYVIRRKQKKRK